MTEETQDTQAIAELMIKTLVHHAKTHRKTPKKHVLFTDTINTP